MRWRTVSSEERRVSEQQEEVRKKKALLEETLAPLERDKEKCKLMAQHYAGPDFDVEAVL